MTTGSLTRSLSVSLLLVSAAASIAWGSQQQWPQWRGPQRDGISPATGLLQEWPAAGPPMAWQASGAGAGYSSFAVADGRLYTLGARRDTEYVMAFDAASGEKLWEVANGARFDNERGDGPRSTPTVDGDRLYVFGSSGDLTVLDAASGDVFWTQNLLERFGGRNISWGLSESPLVLDDRIVVAPGGRDAAIVALRKSDGATIWTSLSDEPGYASALLHPVGDVRQAIVFTARRALGIDVADGRLLWSYGRVANGIANVATPIARGDRVFLSSDYGTGAALLALTAAGDQVDASEVYFTRDMRNHHASSILVGEHLYGFSSSILTAMRFDTGEVAWRDRSVGKGSLVYADERLYLYSENGVVGLAEANPQKYVEHGRFELETGSAPTWAHPVVADGKLFLRDQDTLYAYDVSAR